MTVRVLVFGVSGMLGSATFSVFSEDENYEVFGTARSAGVKKFFPENWHENILPGVDVLDSDSLVKVMGQVKPDVVINCVGLIKQLEMANDPLVVLPINSIFPHRLAAICELSGARLIQISTDCVFDGKKGGYVESDQSNATDLYGQSKHIGEVCSHPHVITLRTSIIGHELNSQHALVDWFLAQTGSIKGFKQAFFSGLPTVELARVIKDYVIPMEELSGLYHVSATPISKFDLLSLVSEIYNKEIDIIPEDDFILDRSLNSDHFQKVVGYQPPNWNDLIKIMHKEQDTK